MKDLLRDELPVTESAPELEDPPPVEDSVWRTNS